MRSIKTSLLAASVAGLLVQSASAANLVAYYEFEGNYNGTVGPAAVPAMNPGELSFVGGFRGQGVNIGDPSAGVNNSGGSVNIPIDANPGVLPDVSYGGWVNINSFEFDGFMATDNGGWDRGITVNSSANAFGVASGAAPALAGTITPGSWQFVVATHSRANNRSTIYVGDDLPGVSTTLTNTTVDNNAIGEPVIEIGRYDNQDLDAIVDDIFVFGSELNSFEVNAIRNLSLSGLDFNPAMANDLFNLYDASGTGTVGGLVWSPTSGLNSTNPGEVFALGGGQWAVVLDGNGNGLMGVPEPSASLLIGLAGVALIFRRRRRA